MKIQHILLLLLSFAGLQLFSNLTAWESAVVAFFIYFFLEFLSGLGFRIAILDLTIILAFFTWLVMPVIFYHEYTREFSLARLWYKYLPIPSDEYFSFALPATLMMALGFRVPFYRS